jgi:ABC-type lipoprotein release transport system permease subunit
MVGAAMRRALVVVGMLIACGGGGPSPPTPEEQLRRVLVEYNGHVVVLKGADFTDHRDVVGVIRREPGVTSATPIAYYEAIIMRAGGESRAIAIKGIAPDDTPLSKRLTPPDVLAGYRPPGVAPPAPPAANAANAAFDPAPDDFPAIAADELTEPVEVGADRAAPPAVPPLAGPVHVVMGLALARDLDVKVGDVVRVVIPGPMDLATFKPGDPIPRDVRVVGTMVTHEEYDARTLLTTFEAAQALQGSGDRAMGIEVRVTDERAAARIARAIQDRLGPPYEAVNWCELNKDVLKCKP